LEKTQLVFYSEAYGGAFKKVKKLFGSAIPVESVIGSKTKSR